MQRIYDKCRRREPLSREEAYRLYDQAPLQELALVADEVRRAMVPDPEVVTWQIDRNVNITNVCISGCRFCNFHCKPHQTDRAFVTTLAEYREDRPYAGAGRRPAAVAGRPASATAH